MRYEGNPKHKEPWQRGRRGSLCPPELKEMVADLLEQSRTVDGKRWTAHDGRAYCAQEHEEDVWHGYPVGWKEVPTRLRNEWKARGMIRRRDIERHWDG